MARKNPYYNKLIPGWIYFDNNNDFHREDGPAIIEANGSKEWWQNGNLHRIDGPAIEQVNGHKEWWQNHQRHREDGPAVIFPDGKHYWYFKNRKLKFENWLKRVNLSNEEIALLRLTYGLEF